MSRSGAWATKSVEKIQGFANVRGESLLQALSDEEVLDTLPGKAYSGVKTWWSASISAAMRETI